MKKIISTLAVLFFVVSMLEAAVTIRYENKDSKTHKMEVKISGSTTTVEFGSSKTSSVTIQGGSTECVIKTSCGEVKVKSGDRVIIKDGCIKID